MKKGRKNRKNRTSGEHFQNDKRREQQESEKVENEISPGLIEQAEKYLFNNYDLKRNIVLNRIFISQKGKSEYKVVEDREFNSLVTEMNKKGIRVNPTTLRIVLNSNFVPDCDPFAEYYSSLPKWDSHDHIGDLIATVQTDVQELLDLLFRKWIVASVACQLKEGIENQTVLILQGEQGIGKTRWLNSIIPIPLSKYVYSGSINRGKDSLINLAECGWIIMDELASMSEMNTEKLKEIITQGSIRTRRPYAQFSESLVRRASFMGSTNNLHFLVDTTGNRRYLPFEVKKINPDHGIDLEQLYAQAYHLYQNGFTHWLEKEDIQKLEEHNKKYQKVSHEEDLIVQHFELCNEDDPDAVFWNATKVMQHLHSLGHIHQSERTKQRIGAVLTKYFRRVKKGGIYVYILKIKPIISLKE